MDAPHLDASNGLNFHDIVQVFLPSIRDRIIREDNKFLLLLDNAPSQPSEDELNAVGPCCTTKFLPPNVKSLVQPVDQ